MVDAEVSIVILKINLSCNNIFPLSAKFFTVDKHSSKTEQSSKRAIVIFASAYALPHIKVAHVRLSIAHITK